MKYMPDIIKDFYKYIFIYVTIMFPIQNLYQNYIIMHSDKALVKIETILNNSHHKSALKLWIEKYS